jgi:hypothetical protein
VHPHIEYLARTLVTSATVTRAFAERYPAQRDATGEYDDVNARFEQFLTVLRDIEAITDAKVWHHGLGEACKPTQLAGYDELGRRQLILTQSSGHRRLLLRAETDVLFGDGFFGIVTDIDAAKQPFRSNNFGDALEWFVQAAGPFVINDIALPDSPGLR